MRIDELTFKTMIALTQGWLSQETQELLKPDAVLAAMKGRFEGVLGDLVAISSAAQADTELVALGDELTRLDRRHDRKRRGVRSVLLGFAELAEQDTQATEAQAVLDLLMPDGLAINKATYVEEAGAASQLKAQLDEALRGRIAAFPSPNGTLLDDVDGFIDAGLRLGELEERRVKLLQQRTVAPAGPTPTSVRRRWIVLARALELNLKTSTELPEGATELVLAALQRELART